MLVALLLLACAAPSSKADPLDTAAPAEATPELSALSLSCDAAAESWSLSATATAWTGGGALWVTRDQSYVERHGVPSVSAASDGSKDTLKLTLAIVADWRYASSGSSTAFRCPDEPALSFLFVIYSTDGSTKPDCRVWGAAPEGWTEVPDVPTCDTLLEVEDSG